MKKKHLSLFLLSIILSGNSILYALSPDGQALWKFKTGIKSSDGVLSYWREEDADPCHWPGVTCDGHSKRVIYLKLPFHKLSGYLSPYLGKLDKLRKLGLHHNNLFGTIPPDLGNCSQLRALHLEMNYLSGHIPGELGKLSHLVTMDISSNSLSGKIPVSFGNLQKLTMFNVSTNFLSGDIPDNGVMKKFNEKSFVGNLALCGQQVDAICLSQLEGPTTSPDSFTTPIIGLEGAPTSGLQKKAFSFSTQLLVTAIGTVGISLLVALMCFWGWFLYHKFYKKPKLAEADAIVGMLDTPKVVFFHGDLPYSSKEILRKIEMLNESCIIGCGGFGTVYKLVMDDGSTFAVKKIEKRSCGPYALFETELEVLGSIKHRNLVNIRGYCNSPFVRLLIYDYLSKGSLEQGLHEEDSLGFPLLWPDRLKIALGTAQGLAYLHHDCSPRIIHCDIKSSNILLGENLEPRVSDFGLAKLLEDNYSHVTTVVAGTFGYLAPEYLQNGRATEKTDVYSYGVVLLELLSGKRPNDPTFVEKGLNMVGWVNTLVKENNLRLIVDPSCDDLSMRSLEAMISIASMCVKPVPAERPSMRTIVKMLESEIIPPFTSGFYDSSSE